jgi:hypothetical protein
MGPGDQHAAVTRELLVRYLDSWTPAALHGARRVTYAASGDVNASVAALRVFGEFADRLRGRRLTMVLVVPDDGLARAALSTVHSELGAPGELKVHVTSGDLVDALRDENAFGAPIFAYLDREAPLELARNKGTELLVAVEPTGSAGTVERYRATLHEAGLTHAVHVELVDAAGTASLVLFATATPKHLERFKDELWAVDEFAGVRYRDPRDDSGTLVNISLSPDLGPLRRAVLRLLAGKGGQTVSELRHFAQAETLYRPRDVARLVTPLLAGGTLVRDPEKGRLTPETVIRLGRRPAR